MRIAILGTRGIPSAYGGFETFAEELSVRLAARGHDVTVYCRPHGVRVRLRDYHGVRLVFLPSLRHKYFDTLSHTFLSVAHLMAGPRVDVALICNAANSILAWMPRALGTPVIVNVDGLERLRRKWNAVGKAYYRLSEWLSTWLPTAIVTDARCIQRYYLETYGAKSNFIPYGAVPPGEAGSDEIRAIGLEPENYILYVSRLEPENNGLLVVRAFQQVTTGARLAVVGDAPYAADYIREIKRTADPRIVFPGAIYGEGYRQLRAHALLYVHATEVGGTHPALLEAMAAGLPVLYLDTPENREVAGEAGLAFRNSPESLAAQIRLLLSRPDERERLGRLACERARSLYDWEDITTAYEQLFAEFLHQRGPAHQPLAGRGAEGMKNEELRIKN